MRGRAVVDQPKNSSKPTKSTEYTKAIMALLSLSIHLFGEALWSDHGLKLLVIFLGSMASVGKQLDR